MTVTLISLAVAIGSILAPVFTTLINKRYEVKMRKISFDYRVARNELKHVQKEYDDLKSAAEDFVSAANHAIAHEQNFVDSVNRNSEGKHNPPYNPAIETFFQSTHRLRLLISDSEILKKISELTMSIHTISDAKELNTVTQPINELLNQKANEISELNKKLSTLLTRS